MRGGVALPLAGVLLALACNQPTTKTEPSPSELLAQANTRLHASRTTHMEGTGALALKGGASFEFDFRLSGDAELPGKSRLTTQVSFLGQALSVDTITIDGRTFSRQAGSAGWEEGLNASPGGLLDPLGQLDLATVVSVVEVDRPEVDGRRTRHLRYTADPRKLVEQMRSSPAAASYKPLSATGTGEVWIAVEDGQILRQIVKVTFELEDVDNAGQPQSGRTSFEAAFDLRFTLSGRPLSPAITAPPLRIARP